MTKIANKPKNKGGNPAWKKGMKSPNPTGRPKDGESWAAIIKSVGDMYPADLIAFVGKNNDLGRMLSQLPQGTQMKYLVTTRVFASLMFEPTSSLWKDLMDRAEGKVAQNVDLSNSDGTLKPETMKPSEIAERVAALLKANESKDA